MLALVLGAMQLGIGMQSYNAMRGVAADVGRYAVVQYQTGNKLTNAQLQSYGQGIATGAAYHLNASGLRVTVANATNQRVTGAKELTVTVVYRVPNLLTLIDLPEIALTYNRPIFLITGT